MREKLKQIQKKLVAIDLTTEEAKRTMDRAEQNLLDGQIGNEEQLVEKQLEWHEDYQKDMLELRAVIKDFTEEQEAMKEEHEDMDDEVAKLARTLRDMEEKQNEISSK